MDAMQNDGAAVEVLEPVEEVDPVDPEAEISEPAVPVPEAEIEAETEAESEPAAEPAAEPDPEPESEPEASAEPEVPQPRSVEPDPEPSSKAKKRKSAPRSAKTATGTKALVVFRDGKVHYADESVVVLDLDEAAHPDTDVHDVVDKLSELRDTSDSAGRTEAIALVADLIQAKALA
ncbi:hypothetical protein KDL01_30605 [Actinospica durhamensis]|uniref:Uncharacterized protein n=1 Tax=Actinospica durhamensis TaxID=1508375 RepID=A0A941EYY2_9ACTN|nr:hypothetical protein [Actinospica durhamensis]MBR7837669.1 hypothetical protein [Actinospica durhamensis]